jgi:hypothetical protein
MNGVPPDLVAATFYREARAPKMAECGGDE